MKIYVAGPTFTPHAREFLLSHIRHFREHGFDAMGAPDLLATTPQALFDEKETALRKADALVVILDGAQVDDGVACQLGLFYGLMLQDPTKKGIVGLLSDERGLRKSAHGFGLNLFVRGVLENRGKICTHIEDVLKQLEAWRDNRTPT
ncbi:MAG: nucleoside 2-deoxyribosyltransferase [Anaerolineae bacterium]|jgi:nucleoside 2-deoxyribosyltransferase|nr:nucleoside 2-deoxyribosyltransferase [Anaerolineae bacterium]